MISLKQVKHKDLLVNILDWWIFLTAYNIQNRRRKNKKRKLIAETGLIVTSSHEHRKMVARAISLVNYLQVTLLCSEKINGVY